MVNITKATQSSLSTFPYWYMKFTYLQIRVNIHIVFVVVLMHANYMVTEMFQKLKTPATTIRLIEYLQSLVSVSVRCLIK